MARENWESEPCYFRQDFKLISEKVFRSFSLDVKSNVSRESYKLHWQKHEKICWIFHRILRIYCPNKCFPFLSFVKENKLLIMLHHKKVPPPFVSPPLFNLNNLAGISSWFKLVSNLFIGHVEPESEMFVQVWGLYVGSARRRQPKSVEHFVNQQNMTCKLGPSHAFADWWKES